MKICKTRYGIMHTFGDADLISRSIDLYGEWAQDELNILLKWINPGNHVIDVGAFIGTHSRAFANAVGANGSVLSFEPNPNTILLLKKNAAIVETSTIKVMEMALGNKTGTVSLSTDDATNLGTSYIDNQNQLFTVDVLVSKLDDLSVNHVDFLKIDVEGYEAEVLLGAESTIERCRPIIFLGINKLADGIPHLYWSRSHEYTLYGIITDAYNRNNFLSESKNIFGFARECGLLLIPNEKTIDTVIDNQIIPINTPDDMALLLLHKPQYAHEVLSRSTTASVVGINFKSPLSDQLFNLTLSRSWQITKPFRDMKAALRAIRKTIRTINGYHVTESIRLLRNGNFRDFAQKTKKILGIHPNKRQISEETIDWSFVSNCIANNTIPFSFQSHNPATLIVPVYNGFEYLGNFFKSLLQNTTPPYSVLVIDDASTDQKIAPFLRELAKKFPQISLLINHTNLGFVGTVNRGMQEADGDVVLLNTDTILPSYWLERLLTPFLDDDAIASVTPFTNAGAICSFPVILEDNSPIFGLSVESIDLAFKQLYQQAIKIPTAVGFCMAISRKALNATGYFDEETFGRGYGEENDWSMRASYLGFTHALCTNLYVHHAHGGSFLPEEKEKLNAVNIKKVHALHPEYKALVKEFIQQDSPQFYRAAARLILMLRAEKRPILIIDHDRGGGANHFRHNLVENYLKKNHAVCVYTDDYSSELRKITCYSDNETLSLIIPNLYYFSDFLHKFNFSEAHYNNLVFSVAPLEIIDVLSNLPNKTLIKIYIHDFYPVCPSYTLLDYKDNFCQVPDIDFCKNCIQKHQDIFPNAPKDIVLWRNHWKKLFERANDIRCFSADSVQHVKRAYPGIENKIKVTPHILDYFKPMPLSPDFENSLHIAVIGGINKAKGAKILQDFARFIEEHDIPCRITLIGNIAPQYNLPKKVTITGRYNLSDLPEIISNKGIQIIWIPSICPETFSYVTAECMLMNLPITAFDIGAPAERLKHYGKAFFHKSSLPEDLYLDFVKFKNQLTT